MIIGVPKEVKKEEYRVGIVPSGAKELSARGHTVLVEAGAGQGSGFSDSEYATAGARVVADVFRDAELIVKVKEPLPQEFEYFREGQILFTYLHLAPNRALTAFLLRRKITALGYETLERNGALPLLAPMSEVAGRMAPLVGAHYLGVIFGGTGVLASGVAGVKPAKTVILGAGVVGSNAARVSAGIGMQTVVISKEPDQLHRIDELYRGTAVTTLPLTRHVLEEELPTADIVIGAVLVPGAKTPVLVSRNMLGIMKKGAVIVDVSVDQGGCVETSVPTTHDHPVYTVEGIIHYAVANMPGAYPRTSTTALTNATLPYVSLLADFGIDEAMEADSAMRSALNTHQGMVVHKALARSLAMQDEGRLPASHMP